MVRKTISTSLRVQKAFMNINIAFISAIQATNNPDTIRKILNKPNLTNSSALAQKRLANQYVNILMNPSKTDISVAKRSNIQLTNDYTQNLKNMGNFGIITITPIPPPPPPTNTLEQLLKMDNSFVLSNRTKQRYYQTTSTNIDLFTKRLTDLINSTKSIEYISRYINAYRLFIKVEFVDGTLGFQSTPILNNLALDDFLALKEAIELSVLYSEDYPLDSIVQLPIQKILMSYINWYY